MNKRFERNLKIEDLEGVERWKRKNRKYGKNLKRKGWRRERKG